MKANIREVSAILTTCTKAHRPALFLDRDGVIIEDRHHIKNPDDVHLCEGSREIIKSALDKDWWVVVITNQSGIGRHLFTWEDYHLVTRRMLQALGSDSRPSAIYANGYTPGESWQSWRKPNPGMILEAAKRLNINIKDSILIGDRVTDLESGYKAGLKTLIHVTTGHERQERAVVNEFYKKNRIDKKYYLCLRRIQSLKQVKSSIFDSAVSC